MIGQYAAKQLTKKRICELLSIKRNSSYYKPRSIKEQLLTGAAGVVIGKNIYLYPVPEATEMARAIAEQLHKKMG